LKSRPGSPPRSTTLRAERKGDDTGKPLRS
jgi:hypothetical protein